MKTLFLSFIFMASSSHALDCTGLGVYRILDRLIDVGRLHNCKLEILKIDFSEEKTSLLVYGKDLFRCKTTNRVCPKANFELTIDRECFNQKLDESEVLIYSSGYNLDQKKVRNHIKIVKSSKTIINLSFGQTELSNGSRINFVQCQPNALGGIQ